MSYEEEDTCHMRRRLNVRRLLFIPSTHHIWDTATRNLKSQSLTRYCDMYPPPHGCFFKTSQVSALVLCHIVLGPLLGTQCLGTR